LFIIILFLDLERCQSKVISNEICKALGPTPRTKFYVKYEYFKIDFHVSIYISNDIASLVVPDIINAFAASSREEGVRISA
jgi:hypothetical protein